jgi:hypothetical protein
LEKVKSSIEVTFIPQPLSPRRQNEDDLSYIINILSREIDNIRNQLLELKEKIPTQQAAQLLTLGQFAKVVKTEVNDALK